MVAMGKHRCPRLVAEAAVEAQRVAAYLAHAHNRAPHAPRVFGLPHQHAAVHGCRNDAQRLHQRAARSANGRAPPHLRSHEHPWQHDSEHGRVHEAGLDAWARCEARTRTELTQCSWAINTLSRVTWNPALSLPTANDLGLLRDAMNASTSDDAPAAPPAAAPSAPSAAAAAVIRHRRTRWSWLPDASIKSLSCLGMPCARQAVRPSYPARGAVDERTRWRSRRNATTGPSRCGL